MVLKNLVRSLLIFFHLDLTKNLEYDRLTNLILKRVIGKNTNCIDVGCHKGEILEQMIRLAPDGTHYAFEPIPAFYENLCKVFKNKATILPYALAAAPGTSTFQYVKNAPAYSGLNKRKYDVAVPDIEEIKVEIRTLDEIIPENMPVGLIKIDVEGGEFGVLKGAKNLLKKNRPVVIFECGMGASDYYGTSPGELFDFINGEAGLEVSLLRAYIRGQAPLTRAAFEDHFTSNREYYFIAHP